MIDPFGSPASEIIGRTPIGQMVGARRRAVTNAVLGRIKNLGYVSAAQKAHQYRVKNTPKGPSTGAQIGTAVAGAAVSAGIALI